MFATSAAATIILDFTNVNAGGAFHLSPVDGFYNGGVSGDGTSGPDYGITFGVDVGGHPTSAVSVVNEYNGCCEPDSLSDRKGVMSIRPNRFGDELTLINVADGFTKMLSFDYAAYCFVGFEIHSELDGGGQLLASGDFDRDNGADVPCAPDATGAYCFWQTAVVPFSGTAKSVWLYSAKPEASLFDRLAFGYRRDLFPGSVPEPAIWAELTIGFGLAGAVSRRRRRAGAIAS